MKKNKFTLKDLVAGLVFAIIFVLFALCALTPEKDKNGNFTQPFKYWTSEEYYQSNF